MATARGFRPIIGHPFGITQRPVPRDVRSMTSISPFAHTRYGRTPNWTSPDRSDFIVLVIDRGAAPAQPRSSHRNGTGSGGWETPSGPLRRQFSSFHGQKPYERIEVVLNRYRAGHGPGCCLHPGLDRQAGPQRSRLSRRSGQPSPASSEWKETSCWLSTSRLRPVRVPTRLTGGRNYPRLGSRKEGARGRAGPPQPRSGVHQPSGCITFIADKLDQARSRVRGR